VLFVMRPFWAGSRAHREIENSAVLPTDGYAEDANAGSSYTTTKRPLFPSGVAVGSADSWDRGSHRSRDNKPPPHRTSHHVLPAAVVCHDPRKERQFANRHIRDKRLGATYRAEELRRQMLRGPQENTVLRGGSAFHARDAPGYVECDDALQSQGAIRASASDADSSSCSASSDDDTRGQKKRHQSTLRLNKDRTSSRSATEPVSPQRKRRAQVNVNSTGGGEEIANGGDVVVDFF